MVQRATTLDDVDEMGGFDDEFDLDLRVIETAYPIAKLRCDTSDNCGQTCSGSACNSLADNPS
ncbi:MAG: FxLD family lanthipeptide [Pseudonocardiaceae bacterium]